MAEYQTRGSDAGPNFPSMQSEEVQDFRALLLYPISWLNILPKVVKIGPGHWLLFIADCEVIVICVIAKEVTS